MTDDPVATHGHLWVLDDGTPVHAPPGRLTRNDEGQVCCHLCGNWFDHLGAHLRRHRWTAADYRSAVGLAANRALCTGQVSSRIARRQTARWVTDPDTRRAFEAGRRVGLEALTAPDRDRRLAPESQATNAANLRRSRSARDDRGQQELERLARADGVADVDAFLRRRYEAGDSLADLQRLTGWSRPRVRDRLEAAGAAIRVSGRTTPAGRANRAALLDARVASRIGTTDVDGWLRAGRADGLATADLARLAGRSDTWVRTRLTRVPTPSVRRSG